MNARQLPRIEQEEVAPVKTNIMWADSLLATLGVSRSLVSPFPAKHGSGLSFADHTDVTDLPPRGAPV